jgi:hypothetical protein
VSAEAETSTSDLWEECAVVGMMFNVRQKYENSHPFRVRIFTFLGINEDSKRFKVLKSAETLAKTSGSNIMRD